MTESERIEFMGKLEKSLTTAAKSIYEFVRKIYGIKLPENIFQAAIRGYNFPIMMPDGVIHQIEITRLESNNNDDPCSRKHITPTQYRVKVTETYYIVADISKC